MGKFSALLIAGMVAGTPAAATRTPDWSFGGTFGELGMGPQLAIRTEHFGAHIDGAFGQFNGHVGSRSTRYSSRLSVMSAGMMFDVFPLGGQFHISAGARYAASSGIVRATIGQMASNSPATANADRQRLTPAVSLGIGSSRPESPLTWRAEAGLMARGGIKLSKLLSGAWASPDRLAAERADLQNRLGRTFLFPTAQMELAYRF